MPLCHDALAALVESMEAENGHIDENAIRTGRKPDTRREEVHAALPDAGLAVVRLNRLRDQSSASPEHP